MRTEMFCIVFMIAVSGRCLVNGAEEALEERCGNELQKVVACLDFATGKAETPGKECCDSASSINVSDRPVCLCYIIEQVHGGNNSQIKGLGIQEGRLLRLPSSCNIKDVNVTNCPKLLNIPANSPDAAFFTNATTSSSTTGNSSSHSFNHAAHFAGPLPIVAAIFFFTYSNMF